MVRRARNSVVAVVIALSVSAGSAATAAAASVYWGANIGPHLTGATAPYDMTAADQFESMAGKSMSLMEFSLPWAYCNTTPCRFIPFPTAQMEKIRQRGTIPVFGWASYSQPLTMEQPDFRLANITSGVYDDYIRQWARDARAWGHPFFLQFDWEMNINGLWPYSESVNGNRSGDYVKTWRHVHDIFTQEGATNATWVWCGTAEYAGSLDLKPLYPGDDYVDWSCIDAYNWDYKFSSFSNMLGPTYDAIQAIAPAKPLMIGETASSETGGSKSAWITDALSAQIPRRFPNIKGLVWFEKYEDRDWPIETTPASKAAFTAGIANPAYAGASAAFSDLSSPIPPLTPVITRSSTAGSGTSPGSAGTEPGTGTSTGGSSRCVPRRSKVTGRRVLVCTRLKVIASLAAERRIRSGLSLPAIVPAANAAFRVGLTRDTKVSLRFERRSGRRFSALPGAIRLKLRRGAHGILFAGRLSDKRSLTPGRYRVTVRALSNAGRSSQAVRRTFTLLP